MPKIDVETLKFILQRNEPDIRKVNEIMQEIEMELKAEEEEKLNRPPPVKKQFSILIADAEGELKDKDLTCLLYTSPSPRDATLSRMPSSA